MRFDPYTIVKHPLMTEKGQRAAEAGNVYPFKVDRAANKHEIKRAVEKIYKVEVLAVRTVNMAGKPHRVRFRKVQGPGWKKAYVKLAQGHVIEVL